MSHILKNPLCPATQVMGKDQHQGRGNPTFYELVKFDGFVKSQPTDLREKRAENVDS